MGNFDLYQQSPRGLVLQLQIAAEQRDPLANAE